MSFNENAISGLNSTLNDFFKIVSEKYNINYNELQQLWSGNIVAPVQIKSSSSELDKLNKSELIEMCKCKQLKVSGTKTDLINRIVQSDNTQKTLILKPQEAPVIKKLIEKSPKLQITKNSFGNFCHNETSFVFDCNTQKVYGKQNKNGTIDVLTSADIDICNKYKFSFMIPNNLDKKVNILDVKVNELDDDVDVEEELEEEFIEEEFVEEEEEEEEEEEYYEE